MCWVSIPRHCVFPTFSNSASMYTVGGRPWILMLVLWDAISMSVVLSCLCALCACEEREIARNSFSPRSSVSLVLFGRCVCPPEPMPCSQAGNLTNEQPPDYGASHSPCLLWSEPPCPSTARKWMFTCNSAPDRMGKGGGQPASPPLLSQWYQR